MTKKWQKKTIGDVCKIINGGTPSTEVNEYWGGPINWITPSDMGKLETPYASKTARTLTHLGLDNCSAQVLGKHSVILSCRAPIGHVALNTEPMATNQGCKGLVPNDSVDSKFLFYYLKSIVDELNDIGTGTTFKEVSASKLALVQMRFPELCEQNRIVEILDRCMELLELLTLNVEENIMQIRSLFANFLNTVFIKRAKSWSSRDLDSVAKFVDYRGKTPPKRDTGIRLITAKNVKMGFIQRNPEEFIEPSAYDGWMTRGFPKRGDVLFTTEAPLGNVAQIDTDEVVMIGQRLITLQADEKIMDSSFLKFALMSPSVQSRIQSKATGATVLGIKASLLKKIDIYFPLDVEQQKQIAGEIEEVERCTKLIESIYSSKLKKISDLRTSMLNYAFSGNLHTAEALLSGI